MKCFYHPTAEAVAICKHCHRALCPGCAAEMSEGMACKGRCEESVRSAERMIRELSISIPETKALLERAARVRGRSSGSLRQWGLVTALGGGIVTLVGGLEWRNGQENSGLLLIGLILLLAGFLVWGFQKLWKTPFF